MKRTRVSAIIRFTDFLGAGITVTLTLFLCCSVCAHNTMLTVSTFLQTVSGFFSSLCVFLSFLRLLIDQ
ncbi:hypothetical protein JHK85_011548 [Glycine max]|uniref:CASP-like protein n=2 Tax=Glycine subgen. Soja TaxID=1462606 RepID=A0A0R0KJ24_SOYBN|nr:hypothetical protein JHK87_011113 [Glycine soja]KAG5050445.1 hypothetical protein JHK85_011548 [Glycine max]KAG5067500.1 hypothetical protein JHK86_011231 [Glycine max]KAH1113032.1 hypothetical protein GYH30_010977 [Glycine max]RZC18177.1 hypothetical protein D0Y65_010707 [Glycine soja]